jgi:uncharacterized membrane protein (DUF4010 family)
MLLAAAHAHGAWPIAAAAGIGLLIGLERERRKVHAGHKGTAGVRTFTLVALLGALAARTGETAILAVACGFVGVAALVGYWRVGDPGLTTEVAIVIAFLLGALAQDDVELAAAIGVGVTLLLAERTRLQHLARDVLTEDELHDGLLLAACAVIVLALLPDHGIGPGDALNPVTVWRLVVVLMLINALGYIALRVLGTRRGLPLAGFVGGFVSSPATIAAMGMRARREPEISRGAVAAAVASTVATSILTGIVVAVADTQVLAAVSLALVFAAVTALVVALGAARRVPDSQEDDAGRLAYGRAFDIKAPLILAGTISLVLAGAHVLQNALGTSGALIAIALGGLADSQSAAVSAASLAAAGSLSVRDAALGVAIALSTNTISKAIAALAFKRPGEIRRVWWGLAAVLAATWVGLAVGAGLGL